MTSELKGKGLELVMIDFRENPDLVRRTVKERGYTGRVLLDESGDHAVVHIRAGPDLDARAPVPDVVAEPAASVGVL